MGATFDFADGRWWHAAFGAANIALLGYSVAFFIGLRQAGADLTAPMAHLRSGARCRAAG